MLFPGIFPFKDCDLEQQAETGVVQKQAVIIVTSEMNRFIACLAVMLQLQEVSRQDIPVGDQKASIPSLYHFCILLPNEDVYFGEIGLHM